MKTPVPLLRLLPGLFVLAMCVRCSSPMPVGPPVTTPLPTPPVSQTAPTSQTVVSVGLPKVTTATFTGVPTENIRVDTVNQTITISLPENYFVLKPTLTVVLSCTDCFVQYAPTNNPTSQVFSLNETFRGQDGTSIVRLQRPGDNRTNAYKIILKQDNPLRISPLTKPLQTELGGPYMMAVPVQNYLDGVFAQVLLTNKLSGKQYEFLGYTCSLDDHGCSQAGPDKMYFSVGALFPGEYTLVIKKATGREAISSYPVIVNRGKLQLSGVARIVIGQDKTTVHGLNLYEDNQSKLLINNLKNYSTETDLVNFTENTQQATVILPTYLKPGNYWARVKQQNGVVSESRRFSVLTDDRQPYLFSLYDERYTRLDLDQISDEPISLMREKRYYAEVTLSPRNLKQHQLKLVDVADAQRVVLIDMYVSDSYYSYGSDGGFPPSFVIPDTVAPSLYRVSFLVGIDANTVRETPAFEQVFDVK